MQKEPAQSLIVRLPVGEARRVRQLVDQIGSAYSSIDEFIRVAVENQLTLESCSEEFPSSTGGSGQGESSAVGTLSGFTSRSRYQQESTSEQSRPTDSIAIADFEDMLRLPKSTELSLRDVMNIPGLPLSPFTNRLAPLLAGPRVLANLSNEFGTPSVDAYLDITAKASRAFGLRLRVEDEVANRRGRNRRSTAWPIGEDESKSLIRYRSCFMFSTEKGGGYAGPLLELGLIVITDGKAYLTESGAAFAVSPSPAVDMPGGIDVLSEEHQRILTRALVQIPGELAEIRKFLDAVQSASGSQDEVDKQLSAIHSEWSEALVVSHRAAIVGRLRDLQVIEVEALPSAKSQIVFGKNYITFLGLIDEIE